jgi:hypothetical protein
VRSVKPSSSPAAERVIVDPIDLPSGATETTPVTEPAVGPKQPGENPNLTPPETEGSQNPRGDQNIP